MTPPLDPEYNKMLSMPASLQGPRKDTIDSIQNQIDFHIAEAHRLRYIQNSHVAISRLPAELLSDVFLYVVEAGLKGGDTIFIIGTFAFLRVCRRWNEIAIGFPQLWVWRIPGALKAWDLFESRSKDAPLLLTWRTRLPKSALNILTGTETPRRIRQLDFNGTCEQLEHILGTLDSGSTSTTSSILLQLNRYEKNRGGEHLGRFFSLSFPKLSKLDINTFLPDPTSSVLTTSNLTSLKLDIPYDDNRRYTRSQFLQVLGQHPSLKQLDLTAGGMPSIENSGELVPVVLPRLVELRLCGMGEVIDGFIDLVSMSSPLHNVIISFQHNDDAPLANTTKKLLTAYYGSKGLEHPRKATHLTVSARDLLENNLTISSKTRSVFASHPIYNLDLYFRRTWGTLAQKIIPLFPLKHVHEYAIERLNLSTDDWRRMLQKMNGLLHLQLDGTNVGPVLNALDLSDEVKLDQHIAPKLKLLSIRNVDIYDDLHDELLDTLKERRIHNIGLKCLAIRSCSVLTLEYKKELEGLAERLIWENVMEMVSDDEIESEGEIDWENEYYDHAYWSP